MTVILGTSRGFGHGEKRTASRSRVARPNNQESISAVVFGSRGVGGIALTKPQVPCLSHILSDQNFGRRLHQREGQARALPPIPDPSEPAESLVCRLHILGPPQKTNPKEGLAVLHHLAKAVWRSLCNPAQFRARCTG